MRILPDLPDLQILPTDSLRPHELEDVGRAGPLIEALKREGVLRNPPIVLRLAGPSERYVVLDGANRTSAFRSLGIEHVLAQIVHPGASRVDVETWNHALLGLPEPDLLEGLRSVPEIGLVESDLESASAELHLGTSLAYLSLRGGRVVSLVADVPDLASRVAGLHRLVSTYRARVSVERTNARELREVERAFPSAEGLIVGLPFTVQDVVEAVSEELLLPGGLTRFVVSPRALRLKYPLEALMRDGDRATKQQELEAWLREQVAGRRVRYYAEATYLFDE